MLSLEEGGPSCAFYSAGAVPGVWKWTVAECRADSRVWILVVSVQRSP